jgi:hypothetical protein
MIGGGVANGVHLGVHGSLSAIKSTDGGKYMMLEIQLKWS